MDNHYRPPGGDPGDHQPTEQFWPGQAGPPGGGQGTPTGSQDPGQRQPGLQAHMATDRRKALRWTAGIALAAVLIGGGVIAGIHLASPTLSTTPAASTSVTGTGSTSTAGGAAAGAGQASQAALLNAALNAAASPNAAAATAATAGAASPGAGTLAGPAGAGPALRPCARAVRAARLARLAGRPVLARRLANSALLRCRFVRHPIIRFFLLRGIDGEFSFRSRTGAIRTLAYERGVIESINGSSSIVVKGADGTTSSWALVGNTVVREQTGVVSESTLSDGEQVWVGGPVVNGTKDARLIFVNPPGGSS
jgi:hypothetical protein